MSKNSAGRDRVVITADNVEKATAYSALLFIKDHEQYEFFDDTVMMDCALKAEVKLLSLYEVVGKTPNHPYEAVDFYAGQLTGDIPRYYRDNDSVGVVVPYKLQGDFGLDQPVQVELELAMPTEAPDDISTAVSGQHYNEVVPGFQYMEMMQHMLADKEGVEAHLLGQVYKYLMRAGKKDDVEQEYRKARWYLNALVKFKQTGEVDCSGND
jgi:hypothetical protein